MHTAPLSRHRGLLLMATSESVKYLATTIAQLADLVAHSDILTPEGRSLGRKIRQIIGFLDAGLRKGILDGREPSGEQELERRLGAILGLLEGSKEGANTSSLMSAEALADQLALDFGLYPSSKGSEFGRSDREITLLKARVTNQVRTLEDEIRASEKRLKELRLNVLEVRQDEAKVLERLEGRFGTLEAEYRNRLSTLEAETAERDEIRENTASAKVAILSNLQTRAEALVGVIGNTGLIGGYQQVADNAARTALKWNAIALVSMCGLVGFAIYAFLPHLTGTFDWGTFASRVFVSLTVGIVAGYAIRMAEKYQDVERQYRRMEIQLASLEPYLQALPEDKRVEIKCNLAEKLFAQPEPMKRKGKDAAGTVIEALRMVLENYPNPYRPKGD